MLSSILFTLHVLNTSLAQMVQSKSKTVILELTSVFLQTSSSKWSFQSQIYADGNKTTPFSQLQLSSYQRVFHTHPRTPLTFSLRLLSDAF